MLKSNYKKEIKENPDMYKNSVQKITDSFRKRETEQKTKRVVLIELGVLILAIIIDLFRIMSNESTVFTKKIQVENAQKFEIIMENNAPN